MRRDIVARLDATVDPADRWAIARFGPRVPKDPLVKLVDKRTGAPRCAHSFRRAALVKWLGTKGRFRDVCPRCDRETIGNGEPTEPEAPEEKKDVRPLIDSTPEQKFISLCLTNHYEKKTRMPESLREGASGIPGAGTGLFATEDLRDEEFVGRYTGKLMFKESEKIASTSDKVFEFSVWNNVIYVDAADSWAGKINHKWLWPYLAMTKDELRKEGIARRPPLPEAWKDVFANVFVDEEGGIFVTRFVSRGEELAADYTFNFWGDTKPVWDITGLSVQEQSRLLGQLDVDPKLKRLRDASTVKTDVIVIEEEEEEGEAARKKQRTGGRNAKQAPP